MPNSFETAHAVADVYAEALLGEAERRVEADELAEQFGVLVERVRSDKDLAAFLDSAIIGEDQRRESLRRMFGQERLMELLLRLLLVLNNRGRLGVLAAVYEAYCQKLDALRGRQKVRVTTAVALSTDQRRQIQTAISRYIGRQAVLVEQVEPELVGGLMVEVDDRRIDGSVRRQLDDLNKQIRRRAGQELQSGRGFVERSAEA